MNASGWREPMTMLQPGYAEVSIVIAHLQHERGVETHCCGHLDSRPKARAAGRADCIRTDPS